MGLNWVTNDYFVLLLQRDKRAHSALEMLVDDLHAEKERTINRFLCHTGSEDFLWGLIRLLGSDNSRVAGNAAYILGTLAENETGSLRVISLMSNKHPDTGHILHDLTKMLTFDDPESVMNAAGTMGTLAESAEGRQWMLKESCLPQTISHVTALLSSDNLWTASNAALVLARISISEEGCEKILGHEQMEKTLCQLIRSLGVDEAGRGMNAAFAVGRLCDLETGRKSLLVLQESEKMISSLANMLCCSDLGASKNACFALSCLATNKDGHLRLLRNSHSEEVIKTLSELLSAEDSETGWFAAMTLKTLASQPQGCVRLREHSSVLPALKSIEGRSDVNPDLREEVTQTLELLKRLDKPLPPNVQVLGSDELFICWNALTTKSGLQVRHHLFEGGQRVYSGFDLQFTLKGLKPYTEYSLRLRASVEGDDSPLSEASVVSTGESVPGPPQNLRVLGSTTTQLKIGWEPPDEENGILRGYYVYNGEKMVDHTSELNCILSGLQPSTSYEIQVCAATSKGKGPRDIITGTTSELGAHAPSKPDVTVRGRNEIYIQWRPPEVPLGRISRYDLAMNGEVIYSGTELHHVARRLKPDTEYSFTVSAITSEGRCESKASKKRTAKDEYEGDRAPLYQSPPKKENTVLELEKKEETKPKRRKSVTESGKRSNSAQKVPAEGAPVYKLTYTTAAKKPKVKEVKEVKVTATETSDNSQSTSVEQANKEKRLVKHVPIPSPPVLFGTPSMAEAWEFSLNSYNPVELHRVATTLSAPKPVKASKQKESQDTVAPPVGDESNQSTGKTLPKPRPPPGLLRTRQRTRLSKSLDSADALLPRRQKSAPSVNSETDAPSKKYKPKPVLHVPHREGKEKQEIEKIKETLQQSQRRHSLSSQREAKIAEASRGEMEKQVTWAGHLSHSQRSDHTEMTRGLSNLDSSYNSSPFRNKRVEVTEFDAPLPASKGSIGQTVPTHVHRANTFIANHRSPPRRSQEKSPLPPPVRLSQEPSPAPHHWSPEISRETQLRKSNNHNKFVPMQYRTQPCNLPGMVPRQVTSLAGLDRGVMPSLDLVGRSRTEVNLRGQSRVIPAPDGLSGMTPTFTLTSQKLAKDRLLGGQPLASVGSEGDVDPPYRGTLHAATRGRQQSSQAVVAPYPTVPSVNSVSRGEINLQSAR